MKPRFNLALDSGAFTLFTKHFVKAEKRYKNGARATPSAKSDPVHAKAFVASRLFQDYLLAYTNFLHLHKNELDFYVTVDVLDNVGLTKDILEVLKFAGLKPMPVYHYGEPISVFKDYCRDHEYVALGGNSPSGAAPLVQWAAPLFKHLCGPAMKFAPSVKIHALGMTSVPFMAHFPIYSFDSTAWAYQSRTGAILLPRLDHHGRARWLDRWMNVPVTVRTKKNPKHWTHISPALRGHVTEYLQASNFTPQELFESYTQRDCVNMLYWFGVQRELNGYYRQRWGYDGGKMYLSGNPTSGGDDPQVYSNTMRLAALRAGISDIYFLATYYYKNDLKELLAVQRWWDSVLKRRR